MFEQIFNEMETQHTIFTELSQLIQNSIDGKNVCIFAYGQTGSGKTYTLLGPE
jgi:kinesin family member C1